MINQTVTWIHYKISQHQLSIFTKIALCQRKKMSCPTIEKKKKKANEMGYTIQIPVKNKFV